MSRALVELVECGFSVSAGEVAVKSVGTEFQKRCAITVFLFSRDLTKQLAQEMPNLDQLKKNPSQIITQEIPLFNNDCKKLFDAFVFFCYSCLFNPVIVFMFLIQTNLKKKLSFRPMFCS